MSLFPILIDLEQLIKLYSYSYNVTSIVNILDVTSPVVRVGPKSVQRINKQLCEVDAVHKQTLCVLVDINQLCHWDE